MLVHCGVRTVTARQHSSLCTVTLTRIRPVIISFSGSHCSVCLWCSADKRPYILGNRFIQQLLTCHAPWWLTDEYTGVARTKLRFLLSILADGKLTRQWKNSLIVASAWIHAGVVTVYKGKHGKFLTTLQKCNCLEILEKKSHCCLWCVNLWFIITPIPKNIGTLSKM